MPTAADPKARDTRNWRTASSAPPRSRPSRAGTQSPSGRSTSSPSRSVRPPPEVLAATDSYRAINDPLVAFFSYCCRRDDAAATVEAGKLYAAYTAWCDATGERPRSQRSLGVILTERGIQRVLDPQTRRTLYVGVGLLGAEGTAANPGALEAQPRTDDLPGPLDDLTDLFG